ncbi:DUF2795 domain-containing protein [Streptomyces aureocirculatus]|uniref:DUF2795 domain-containing protein n=1 Tax=Streptomyces aureocirculatus TaxID=67275 RepID=UPI0004CBBF8A|nr:DUF2795 domain-containing protein [Streptomyces aureocirculatus]
MERGSNPVGPRKDDELKHELKGYLQSGQHTHVEEGNDPEPPADDDIRVDPGGPVPPPGAEREQARADGETESLRLELARHLEPSVFPADRQTVLEALQAHHAPDTLLDFVRSLPDSGTYANVSGLLATESDRRQAE